MGTDYVLYDTVSRVTKGTALNAGNKHQEYVFDSYGNIGSMTTVVNGSPTTRSIGITPGTNRLSIATYDDAGNQLSYGSASYVYDSMGMMKTLQDPNRFLMFYYTADDERILVRDPSPRNWFWRLRGLGDEVLTEFVNNESSGWTKKDWIYRDGVLLASTTGTSASKRFFAVDHLGTPRQITDWNRARIGLHAYYAFGEEATSNTQNQEFMKFTGHERDSCCTGSADYLDYQHARHYSPTLGRSQSVDPASDSAYLAMPQTWSRYSYVAGNPLNYDDPNGTARRARIVRVANHPVPLSPARNRPINTLIPFPNRYDYFQGPIARRVLVSGWCGALIEPTPVGEGIMIGITIGFIIGDCVAILTEADLKDLERYCENRYRDSVIWIESNRHRMSEKVYKRFHRIARNAWLRCRFGQDVRFPGEGETSP